MQRYPGHYIDAIAPFAIIVAKSNEIVLAVRLLENIHSMASVFCQGMVQIRSDSERTSCFGTSDFVFEKILDIGFLGFFDPVNIPCHNKSKIGVGVTSLMNWLKQDH